MEHSLRRERAGKSNVIGSTISSDKDLVKCNISADFFAYSKSFMQLLLWVIHTNEVYDISNTNPGAECVQFPTSMRLSNQSKWGREKHVKNRIRAFFDYVYIKEGQLAGLRKRSSKEFGHMVSKIQYRCLNRRSLIASAIANNQRWIQKFILAKKNKKVLKGIRCFCSTNTRTKTIADAFIFCENCQVFCKTS